MQSKHAAKLNRAIATALKAFTKARDEAWKAREHLKYNPLPLHEIAKGEFDAGADFGFAWAMDSLAIKGIVEALQVNLWKITGDKDHDWRTCDQPSCVMAREALAAFEKARGE